VLSLESASGFLSSATFQSLFVWCISYRTRPHHRVAVSVFMRPCCPARLACIDAHVFIVVWANKWLIDWSFSIPSLSPSVSLPDFLGLKTHVFASLFHHRQQAPTYGCGGGGYKCTLQRYGLSGCSTRIEKQAPTVILAVVVKWIQSCCQRLTEAVKTQKSNFERDPGGRENLQHSARFPE